MKDIKKPIAVIPELAEGAEAAERTEARLLSLVEVKKLEELIG